MRPSTHLLWRTTFVFIVSALSIYALSGCSATNPADAIVPMPQTKLVQASETVAHETVISETVALPSPTPASEEITTAQETPQTETTPQPPTPGVAPAPAPVGTVVYYESSIEIPTYPYEPYTTNELDATFNWPYKRFDLDRFEQSQPVPVNKTYRLIVLENAYLQILVAPELGGRILQVFHKPSGDSMLYRNFVIKPSRWGPGNQRGWIAAGGIEWNLPVVEHGYDWGTSWGILPLQHSEDLATVTVFTPHDGRFLNASITIGLRSGAASFDIQPTISNLSQSEITFDYWHSAALAPGAGNQISGDLRFIIPTDQMTIHSTQDPVFPAPGQQISWPFLPDGRDVSRLGNWQQFAGMFEYPAAHGPFVGIYDASVDDGAVRVFPADIAQGSKIFALGWGDALNSKNYTDDGSQYVELHGGLATTFDKHTTLAAGGMVSWQESWYPVHGVGGISTANEIASLFVERKTSGLFVGIYPTRPFDGMLKISSEGQTIVETKIQARPDLPFAEVAIAGDVPTTALSVQLLDTLGNEILEYTIH